MISTGGAFLASAVRTATPLALAALGELVVERAGVINISLEGVVLFGAFGALAGATHGGVAGGIAAALACGILTAAVFAVFAVGLRADQIITGTAVTLLAFGATGTLYRAFYGAHGAALSIPTTGPVPIPVLANIPVIGPGLFDQPAFTYVVYLLIPFLWWWMYRRGEGLSLRAIGESPAAARAAGVAVSRFRSLAILFGGAAGGLAGATLVLAQAGTFAEGMSAGRGFVAIAIVVLGRWHPMGIALASLGWGSPYQLALALPYALTLVGLAGVAGRVGAPAALARIDDA
jgi:simple sugar transport system permease protein